MTLLRLRLHYWSKYKNKISNGKIGYGYSNRMLARRDTSIDTSAIANFWKIEQGIWLCVPYGCKPEFNNILYKRITTLRYQKLNGPLHRFLSVPLETINEKKTRSFHKHNSNLNKDYTEKDLNRPGRFIYGYWKHCMIYGIMGSNRERRLYDRYNDSRLDMIMIDRAWGITPFHHLCL